MFLYQKYSTYFAQCPEELRSLAQKEFNDFGIIDRQNTYKGFYFKANQEQLYYLTYNCRIINRILAPLSSYKVFSTDALYKFIYNLPWEQLIKIEESFVVFANVSHSQIKHSQYALQRMKDAIVDRFRDQFGKRPSVNRDNPDITLNLFINENKATVNLDVGGRSLHKRGYRKASVTAPIQENIASAFVQLAGWKGEQSLYDIFCGSGTIAFEAGMLYCRIPSAYLLDNFGFYYLPDFNKSLWEKVRYLSNKNIRNLPKNLIYVSDCDAEALDSLRTNMKLLPQLAHIKIVHQDYQDIKEIKDSTIITNPPYGIRLNLNQGEKLFAKDLGDFLKQRCTGSRAFIYFGNRSMIKCIGLRSKRKHLINSGGLDGRLVEYDLY